MNCLKCGKEIPRESIFCEYCGAKQAVKNRSHTVLWVCIIAIIAAISATIYVLFKPTDYKNSINEDKVLEVINKFNDAYATNDYVILSLVYSDYVDRFHNAYNLSNSQVIEKYRNYDKKFGVYAKHINVRWNTLHIEKISEDELAVVFIEDFSIDRVDNTKYSIFELEEHLILDSDYKIKSIYDNQLSKRKK